MESKGIFEAKRKDNSIYYRVSITKNRKHISLGSFDDREKAGICYKEAQKIFNDLSINIDSYEEFESISFDKFICLLNFRDNGLYISNPIYLKSNFFLYYLDTESVLKFDRDDLFYYSTHKIIRRSNHLFCNEYGNQINILERYSINSYAVNGRDYKFINGDTFDFRYSNLEIINRFHGVTKKIIKNKTVYEVKIHVKGYLKVGEFADEATAAVAYNKAADILKKSTGKNFMQNFPEISPKDYALIYSKINIPDSIMNYNNQK